MQMAHWPDSKTGVQAAWLWTDEEIDLLLSGQSVPYRTTHGCAGKLRRLGIRKGPGHYLVRAPYQPPSRFRARSLGQHGGGART